MEKEFLIKHNGKESVVSEKLAQKLGRQVDIVGEVTGVHRTKGKERLTPDEFRKQHIRTETDSEGKQRRTIDKGYSVSYDVDKKSRPGRVRRTGTAYRDSVVLEGGREVPREEWNQSRRQA